MRRTRMFAFALAAALLALAGCGGRAPTSAPAPYTIVSQSSEEAGRSATVIITVPEALTPTEIKAAADSIIAARRAQFARVTVKTFTEAADLNGVPLAVSTFDGTAVNHVFSAAMPRTERIPTH